jgi:hypothetical protein
MWRKSWFGYFLVVIAVAFAVWWYFRVPPPGYSVTAMGVAAGIMALRAEISGREKWLWTLILFAFALVEIRAISHDRTVHDKEQAATRAREAQNFSDIGQGIQQSIQGSQRHFDATMGRFAAQTNTLAQLQRNAALLSRQVSEEPLSSMPPEELADKARAAARQMRVYRESYAFQDQEIATRYDDRIESGTMTPKETKQWEKEEQGKRAALRATYEADAKKIIATANRLRAEMVKRLAPSERYQQDEVKTTWFENPVSEKSLSLLYKLDENANYLERLAERVLLVKPIE